VFEGVMVGILLLILIRVLDLVLLHVVVKLMELGPIMIHVVSAVVMDRHVVKAIMVIMK
jgi:hypothetical protein